MGIKELISREEIDKRIKELTNQIDKDYEGKEITAICVLKGAVFLGGRVSVKFEI